jgi:hypothetical protein
VACAAVCTSPLKKEPGHQTDQPLPGWSVIRKLARYVSQNSRGQLDSRKSDCSLAYRWVRLAAAVASAAGRAAGNTYARDVEACSPQCGIFNASKIGQSFCITTLSALYGRFLAFTKSHGSGFAGQF